MSPRRYDLYVKNRLFRALEHPVTNSLDVYGGADQLEVGSLSHERVQQLPQ